jgi:hypothetical protein
MVLFLQKAGMLVVETSLQVPLVMSEVENFLEQSAGVLLPEFLLGGIFRQHGDQPLSEAST